MDVEYRIWSRGHGERGLPGPMSAPMLVGASEPQRIADALEGFQMVPRTAGDLAALGPAFALAGDSIVRLEFEEDPILGLVLTDVMVVGMVGEGYDKPFFVSSDRQTALGSYEYFGPAVRKLQGEGVARTPGDRVKVAGTPLQARTPAQEKVAPGKPN